MCNFWQTLPRPIIGLAPMDGASDHPFRYIQKKYGAPDLVYTEFTSVDEICVARRADRLRSFLYDDSQRPIVAQIFGSVPEHFYQVAILICELGFDGIDINMGCPSRSVTHGGAGAALICTPKLAQEIMYATQRGVRDWQNGAGIVDCPNLGAAIAVEVARQRTLHTNNADRLRPIPVSVKTRIGYDQPVVESWVPTLLEVEPAAIAIHGRTLKQRYSGQADWNAIGQAAEIVRPTATLFLGNGDIVSHTDAHRRVQKWGLDGVLIGRSSLGNPFVFHSSQPRPAAAYLTAATEHAEHYEACYQPYERYHFLPMRKHLSAYARHAGLTESQRRALLKTESADDAIALLQTFIVQGADCTENAVAKLY